MRVLAHVPRLSIAPPPETDPRPLTPAGASSGSEHEWTPRRRSNPIRSFSSIRARPAHAPGRRPWRALLHLSQPFPLVATFLVALLTAGPWTAALAGPHRGGTLILHADPGIAYTGDTADYCGMSHLDSCSAAVTHLDEEPGVTRVFTVFAAFPDTAHPSLMGVTFGLEFDERDLVLVGYGGCGDFEAPQSAWPASGTGTVVTWTAPQESRLVEVYWFAAYRSEEAGASQVLLTPHPEPNLGGHFGDDSIPARLDAIAAFGRLGFGTPGVAACPGEIVIDDDTPPEDIPDEPMDDDPPEDPGDSEDADFLPAINAWITPRAMAFDPDQRAPVPVGQVSFLNDDTRIALVATGATSVQKMFSGTTPADTIRVNDWGDSVRVLDVSGFYRVAYPSVAAAQAAVLALENTPGISGPQVEPLYRQQAIDPPNDPLFNNGDNYQWPLINDGTRQIADSCGQSVAGTDINLPEDWWEFEAPPGRRVMVGCIDTGLPDEHPDLDLVDVSYERYLLQNHPDVSWCLRHGTNMAGLSGATTNNAAGVAGVCPDCGFVDMEGVDPSRCPDSLCALGNHENCEYGGDFADNLHYGSTYFDLGVVNIEYAHATSKELCPPAVLYSIANAYATGSVIVAPVGDKDEDAPQKVYPAGAPYVFGVGGHTHDGRFWGSHSQCMNNPDKGSTPSTAIDICAPADPWTETTYPSGYGYTSGQCSGAAAIVAGGVGLLRTIFEARYPNHYYNNRPTPDDYVGMLTATAKPWDAQHDPRQASRCTSCGPEHFGAGRLDVGAAAELLENLWPDLHYSFLRGREIRWTDPGVSIDSTSVLDMPAKPDPDHPDSLWLVRTYKVTAPVFIPDVGELNLSVRRVAWAAPLHDVQGVTGASTTAPVCYGDVSTQSGRDRRLQFAMSGFTNCEMSPVDQSTGLATMTAYNLAHVWDDNGVEHVEYIVPKAVWRMGYAMVTDQEPTADFIASEPVPEGSTTLYPLRNPVSEDLLVQYSITSPGSVTLEMYDVGGRLVMTAPQGLQQAGRRSATLSRADGLAGRLPAGVYWVRLRAENSSQARRIVLLN